MKRDDFIVNTKGLKIGNVCISSVFSREARFKDFRYAAYKAAKDLGYEVYRNPEYTGATQESFEKYLKNKRPIFVLLVGETKSSVVKEECSMALSLGLPIITLLKTTNGKITPQTQKIMTSISKATFEKSCSCFSDCEDLYAAVQQRLAEYENERNITTANFIPQHAQIYTSSAEIVQSAKKRVVLCQRTSSLLLGPRKGVSFEKEFYDKIFEWIKTSDDEMELLHIFSCDETKKELKGTNYNVNIAEKRLVDLCKKAKLSLVIRAVKQEIMPCVICDNDLMVMLHLGVQEYNLLLSHYITDGATVSKVVADLQGMDGELLYSSESLSTSDIENFYK